MNLAVFYNNLVARHKELEPKINSSANHLIVIFAFSVPLFIQVRRISLFLILLLFLFRGRYIYYIREALREPLVLSFAIYFAIHVIWLIGTNDYSHASKRVHDAAFLLFPLIFSTFIDQRFVSRIFYAFILGMFLSMITSFGLFFELIPPQPFDTKVQGTSINPTPIWNHSIYGFMLIITAALSLQRSFFEKNTNLKILFFIVFISASINTFIILSRFSYISYVIIIFFTLLLILRKRFIISFISALTVCIIILLIASNLSPKFNDRIDKTINSAQSIYYHGDYSHSIGKRIATFDIAIDLIADNFILGLGTGDDIEATKVMLHKKYPDLDNFSQSLQHLHNEYLSAFLQFGFFGLIIFLNIIVQFFRHHHKSNELRNSAKIIGTGVILISITEIFVIGLGALLTTVTLSSLILNNYSIRLREFKPLDYKQLITYSILFILFHAYYLITT